MAAELMEIIQTISQVMADTYDGARDDDGELRKAGLRREDKKDFRSCDCRLMDGFRIKVGAYTDEDESFPCLTINYHSELKLEEVHSSKLDENVESHVAEAIKYLKKEFKKIAKKELVLEKHGEMNLHTEEISRLRTSVVAQCRYKIGNVEFPKLETEKDSKRAEDFKKWLSLGGLKK
mgnify:CR=1 FL=1